jgi:hypothetical protein
MTTAFPNSTNPLDRNARPARTWVKVALAIACAAMAAMWIYYFVFASDKGVYQLQDRTWRVKAAAVCAAADKERGALANTSGGYISKPTAAQMRERADIVDKATDILDHMLTTIVAIPVDNARDRVLLAAFEQQYRTVLSDRRRYTASLRNGKLVPFTESVVGGGPVSNVVDDFTAGVKGNDVPDCTPPSELGGAIQP